MSSRLMKPVVSTLAVGALLIALLIVAAPALSSGKGRVAPAFPFCAWPVESTPALANEAGPDPNATYWTTPFKTGPSFRSVTIKGTYPKARFMSFVVYNDGGDDFTETVNGKSVASAIPDYEISPDRGSVNPWQVDSLPQGRRTNFTVRLRRHVTLAEQRRLNAIPMVDTGTVEQQPIAPSEIGFVTFRTYIPSGGNETVKLPTMIVNKRVKRTVHGSTKTRATHTKLPTCDATRIAHATKLSKGLKKVLQRIDGTSQPATVVTPCDVEGQPRYSNGCAKPLEWIQASSEQIGGLFPNPSNAYISTYFYPAPGTVVVTRGLMPATPRNAGRGEPGNSIGAVPVDWTASPLPYQLRYWSLNNYLVKEPYPGGDRGGRPEPQLRRYRRLPDRGRRRRLLHGRLLAARQQALHRVALGQLGDLDPDAGRSALGRRDAVDAQHDGLLPLRGPEHPARRLGYRIRPQLAGGGNDGPLLPDLRPMLGRGLRSAGRERVLRGQPPGDRTGRRLKGSRRPHVVFGVPPGTLLLTRHRRAGKLTCR